LSDLIAIDNRQLARKAEIKQGGTAKNKKPDIKIKYPNLG
jgi:hypothetical protein